MNRLTKLSLASGLTIAGALVALSQTQPKSEPQEPEKVVVERSEVVLDAVPGEKRRAPLVREQASLEALPLQ